MNSQHPDHRRDEAVFFSTYHRLPPVIASGDGMYLTDTGGKRYLDLFAGLAVNALGYGNPAVLEAIRSQSQRYLHLSNYYLQLPQVALAEQLLSLAGEPYRKVFFCNSGTEATEAAIKLARQWAAGPAGGGGTRKGIISFGNAFHGRTFGALSLMDRPGYRDGFGPFLEGFRSVPLNNPAALRAAAGPSTIAVILEFIQGEGGIYPVTREFAAELLALRKQHGFLLIADEIQAGLGRTGRIFGFDHMIDDAASRPDIVLLAKALGGGLPLGAVVGNDRVAGVLQPGMHGTTFGGNPVSCAAGAAVLNELRTRNLIGHAGAMGELFLAGFRTLQRNYPSLIREVRGFGLMLGIDLTTDAAPVVDAMRERGFLINGTNRTVLRFLPPMIITPEQVAATLAVLDEVLAGEASAQR